jgi:hypothetical protein
MIKDDTTSPAGPSRRQVLAGMGTAGGSRGVGDRRHAVGPTG